MTALRHPEDSRPNAALLQRSLEDRVCDLAEEYFSLQVLGERRAYDCRVTGRPLVYHGYVNGLDKPAGEPLAEFTGNEGVLALVRNLFEYQRSQNNDVIVWRMLPVFDTRDRAPPGLRFRCAFIPRRSLDHERGRHAAD